MAQDNWIVEVNTARELAILTNPQGPQVAFTPLTLDAAATHYLDSINQARVKKMGSFIRPISIEGWNIDPAQSEKPKAALTQWLNKTLPKGEGRTELISGLCEHFAGLASAINRENLYFELRTTLERNKRGRLHLDIENSYNSVTALHGPNSLLANPSSYTAKQIKARSDDDNNDYLECDYTPKIEKALVQAPTRTTVAWRGYENAALHASPQADQRIALIAGNFSRKNTPAIRTLA